MFKALWAAVIGGNPMSWLGIALGAIIVLGSIYGTGWYMGDTHAARIAADAQVQAVQVALAAASKAQAEKDAMDYNTGRADGLRLGLANHAADIAAAKDKAPVMFLRPNSAKVACPDPVLPAEALHRLNDPALTGDAP